MTLLILDDDRSHYSHYKNTFENKVSYQITPSFQDKIEYDLILWDFHTKNCNPTTSIKNLLTLYPQTSVICISDPNLVEEQIVKILNDGAEDVILRPITPLLLWTKVKKKYPH